MKKLTILAFLLIASCSGKSDTTATTTHVQHCATFPQDVDSLRNLGYAVNYSDATGIGYWSVNYHPVVSAPTEDSTVEGCF